MLDLHRLAENKALTEEQKMDEFDALYDKVGKWDSFVPLLVSAYNNNEYNFISHMVNKGANINAQDSTLLNIAISKEDEVGINKLLDLGSIPTKFSLYLGVSTNNTEIAEKLLLKSDELFPNSCLAEISKHKNKELIELVLNNTHATVRESNLVTATTNNIFLIMRTCIV
jgi:hypothetical protein